MLQLVTNVKTNSIRKLLHIILAGLFCCLINGPLMAQVKFYTMVSESDIAVRQTFQVQYIVEGANSIRQFEVPRFKDFEVAEMFDYSTSSFGQGQSLDTYSKIIVLMASKKGKFTIPGATAVINGKQMRSNAVAIAVKAGVPGMNNINPDDIDTEEESLLHPGENIKDKIDKNLFLRVETSKNTCYVGEPLMVVYKAYSRLNANSQVVKRPSLTGFSVMEMVDAYDGKPEIEKLNGRSYYTNLVRKVQLFPLQEGVYTLDPAEIESVVHFVKTNEPASKKRSLSLYNRSGTPMYPLAVDHRTILRTAPVTITVKPLPTANQPADFSGAVGQFTLTVKTPTAPIHVGDLVKIQVTINGSGNLSLLTPPAIKWPKGVDTAEPAVKENINKYIFPLSGSKTFEYSFAAPDTGDFIIPVVHLPYYDPKEKKYKTAASDSITMHVLAGVKKATAGAPASVDQGSGIQPTFYWFGGIVLAIIAVIGYQVISLRNAKKKEKARLTATLPIKETPTPQQIVTRLLANAKQALQNNQPSIFYREVQQALWQVVRDTWRVLPSKLNKYHTTQLLAEKGVPDETIKNFSAILDECEWALYTPDQSIKSMEGLMDKAEVLLKELVENRES
ncbi:MULTISPECIES: BatD family protein [Niastella]|uniref:Protein BatD n=1 Tax=Niastella soli TaxID=2821487 RepID=A0ABS3YQ47_9BACT|nr:BatD family protein [Niastella soli]MBO9200014.1 protein BatD [Niastella soli]